MYIGQRYCKLVLATGDLLTHMLSVRTSRAGQNINKNWNHSAYCSENTELVSYAVHARVKLLAETATQYRWKGH
jgi:hypothetical protein